MTSCLNNVRLLPSGGPSAPGRRWSAPARPCLYVKTAGAPSGLLGKVLLAALRARQKEGLSVTRNKHTFIYTHASAKSRLDSSDNSDSRSSSSRGSL